MLKVASFKISDQVGINALLDKVRLATGMHILVSNGEICIPYEDGEPESIEARISGIGEQKNTMLNQLQIIEHSQSVLDFLIKDSEDRIVGFEADVKEDNANGAHETKKRQKNLDVAREAHEGLLHQKRMNDHEILRLKINIEKFDEQISKLKY